MDSIRASGGSVTIWRRNSLEIIQSFKVVGFVGLKAYHKGTCINFINVYAPCNSILRRKEERIGKCTGNNGRDCTDFFNFVEEMDIIDLPCVGGRFTWFSWNDYAMSRLDQFLIIDNLISLWKFDNQVVGKWVLSDHCPVWLKSSGSDWGSKPFKFNNGWYKHKDFDSFVKKEWRLLSIKGRDLRIEEKIYEQHEVDQFLITIVGGDVSRAVEARRLAADELWNKLEMKECLLRLNSLKEKVRRNSISVVDTPNGQADGVEEVKFHIQEHFERCFKEPCKSRPIPDGIIFKRLEVDADAWLERPFTSEEIKDAVWNCDGCKALGPDGSLHKILSKLLAGRLKEVIDSLISVKHNAFIENRNILDGILMVNEVMDMAKREGLNCLVLKVDYEKSYDYVSWDYIRYVMKKMDFGNKWISLMEASVLASSMYIIVNGSCMKDFKVEQGLRQGDPLSPLLFVIVMEGLTSLMEKETELEEYKGFQFGDNNIVDILHFTDDTIILGDGGVQNLWSLKEILRGFELMSGLKSAPSFKFLGVKVGDSVRKVYMWKDVIRYVRRRLEKWRGRLLSIWWRDLILINDCEGSMGLYVSNMFRCRVKTGETLSFWFSRWAGNQAILDAYPELYAKAAFPFMSIAEACLWDRLEWVWDADCWLQEEDDKDREMLHILIDQFPQLSSKNLGRDVSFWATNEEKWFSVKGCAAEFRRIEAGVGLQHEEIRRMRFMWELKVPSKVGSFAWRYILGRLLTKDQLKLRGW
ncbi:uncharacterized protein LOC131649341 [Vicia villosa]|uniref:uncharacterized protein LOC131649341 n=1 Tax=Vicia villosa TaxID=3911 RepID=UPI00273B924A|nr:uncharacterized protein LOC131649341 [Vicia villosa]